MKEIWKPIPGFDGYEVSNLGKVRSFKRSKYSKSSKLITIQESKKGYSVCNIFPNNGRQKSVKVHRLVMLTFIGPCSEGLEVCHNDGNPKNNRLDNLRYDTHQSNILDAIKMGNQRLQQLTIEEAGKIRELYEKGLSRDELAKEYRVSRRVIGDVIRGKTYSQAKGQTFNKWEISRNRVRDIRIEYAKGDTSLNKLARKYGVSSAGISVIVNGKSFPAEGGPIKGVDY